MRKKLVCFRRILCLFLVLSLLAPMALAVDSRELIDVTEPVVTETESTEVTEPEDTEATESSVATESTDPAEILDPTEETELAEATEPEREGSLLHFTAPDPLPDTPFQDVTGTDWYEKPVKFVYTLGLMQGASKTTFNPNGTVSLAQGLAVAVQVYERYWGIPNEQTAYEGPWYAYYIDRAKQYNILPEALLEADVQRAVTRAELAGILARALPEAELVPLTTLNTMPDYGDTEPYWIEVHLLWEAGVVSCDTAGNFNPESRVRRSELAELLSRLVNPAYRLEPSDSGTSDVVPPEPPEMKAFALPGVLPAMPFRDVPAKAWYREPVHQAYSMGLMAGTGKDTFDPNGYVQISQAVTVAVRIYEMYHGISDETQNGGKPWYASYMVKAKEYHILPEDLFSANPTRLATREEVAVILYNALPEKEFAAKNTVDSLPDYGPNDRYYAQVLAMYRAGIMAGTDAYGTFLPNKNTQRSELATMLIRLSLPNTRADVVLKPVPPKPTKVMKTLTYGTSGKGRDLTAYQYGDGKNVMILTFGIHSWEDNFDRDGQVLFDEAEQVRKALDARYDELVRAGDWTVYVLPTLNPDGLYAGWTCNGPGRCTLTSLDSSGKGIDLNRCFPYCFKPFHTARNYTGDKPLQAVEAQALEKFVKQVKGTGKNVLIDAHGWYAQTIVSGGKNGKIYKTFHQYFPNNRYTSLYGANGYFAAWAAYVAGYDACLFEFPEVRSASAFWKWGYGDAYVKAIADLLKK